VFNQYKQQFDGMMQREINRGEFLKFMGVGLLGLVGAVGFMKNLHQAMPDHSSNKKQVASSGYGRSPYGQ